MVPLKKGVGALPLKKGSAFEKIGENVFVEVKNLPPLIAKVSASDIQIPSLICCLPTWPSEAITSLGA